MATILSHPTTGVTKVVPTGFSWTTLFFGLFPALLRGDIKWAAIMLAAAVCTLGFSALVFPFIYNRLYLDDLIKKGYRPAGMHGAAGQQVIQQFHISAGNGYAPAVAQPSPQTGVPALADRA